MLKSSSKHHSTNMKLFLIVVISCAVALALPAEKRKRDILPGDERYGTDYHLNHHHVHHDNDVEVARAAGGYVGTYSVPETSDVHNSFQVQKAYGPPHYQPGLPIHTDYPIVADVSKQSVSVSTYGAPETPVHVPHVSNRYLEPVIQEAKTHVPTGSFGVPVKTTTAFHTVEQKTPAVLAPTTSYGTPVVVDSVKKTAHLEDAKEESAHTDVLHKTVQTDLVQHKPLEAHKPLLKVTEHVPVTQEVTKFTEVKQIPTFHTTPTQTHFTGSYTPVDTKLTGFTDVSAYHHVEPQYPSGLHQTYEAHNGFPGYGAEYQQHGFLEHTPVKSVNHHQVHVQHQPLSVTPLSVTKHVSYSAPQTVHQVSRPYYIRLEQTIPVHIPQTVTYPVHQNYVETKVAPVAHEHVEVQRGNPVTDYFQNIVQNLQVPSFELPSLPFFNKPSDTPAVSHVVDQGKQVFGTVSHVDHESVTVENPLVNTEQFKPAVKEYVQPTDENGGYIY